MDSNPPVKTIFSYCESGNAADILSGVAYVTCFLREVATAYSDESGAPGLSNEGATGLHLLLCGIEDSVKLAIERL